MISPAQSRAARGLLEWTQTDLAEKANLSESTVRDFEKDRRIPSSNNLAAIVDAFKRAGVVLVKSDPSIGGDGVRFAVDDSQKKIDRLERALEVRNMVLDSALSDYEQDQEDDELAKVLTLARRMQREAESELLKALQARGSLPRLGTKLGPIKRALDLEDRPEPPPSPPKRRRRVI